MTYDSPTAVVLLAVLIVGLWCYGIWLLVRLIVWVGSRAKSMHDTRRADVRKLDELMRQKRERDRLARKYRAR